MHTTSTNDNAKLTDHDWSTTTVWWVVYRTLQVTTDPGPLVNVCVCARGERRVTDRPTLVAQIAGAGL